MVQFPGATIKYINNSNAELAFVSTNSIVQGEQVALFWPYLLIDMNVEIGFAYQSFKWSNNAKSNAGITCVIIGLRNKSAKPKYLYINNHRKSSVGLINAYLSPTRNIFVTKLSNPISNLPQISLGSSAYDGGYLMVTPQEREEILRSSPKAKNLFRRFVGSEEFVRGIERYCLWISDQDLPFARSIPKIKQRLENVKLFREKSKRVQTLGAAEIPHHFTENRHVDKPSILIPIVTSERREYLTLGFLNSGEIIPNSARAIYDGQPYIFGVLSSKMHMVWVKAVGGRLRTDIRYSAGVCYNSFPFPSISNFKKEEVARHVFEILEQRENYSEKTLAQLYDPDEMPAGLREVHRQLDLAVERCYRSRPFDNDEERLECLFKLYEEMIAAEKAKNGELVFDEPVSKKTKRKQHA